MLDPGIDLSGIHNRILSWLARIHVQELFMPSCEIMSIGTELLLGQILNTNAQYLAQELAAIGLNCFYQTTVGDNKSRIIDSIKLALNRSDILLITGGLGPTADDLTTESVAETFAVDLFHDAAVLAWIADLFQQRGYPMPETNRKQALRPQGADLLPNPQGTAPGFIWLLNQELLAQAGISDPQRQRLIMTFPGVPAEMKTMWRATAVPYLVSRYGEQALWSCELKHYGIGESALAEKYAHLLHLQNPTVAPYAGRGECRLRVTARGQSQTEAQKLAQPIIDEIRSHSGSLCYGIDDDTLEIVVGKLLAARNMVLAVAESCTGGLVSKRLTDVAGSSAYVKLNVVTYANEMKEKILQVDHKVLDSQGAVSEECALQMARGIRKLSGADLALSITGIAGPGGGSADKPVGLIYLGLDDGNKAQVRQLKLHSHLSRSEIRQRTASEALNMVRLHLSEMPIRQPAPHMPGAGC
jgi:nicotinamide-nucleotide amidase